jgi:transcriptional regulator with XRE-family HTH domain
MIDMNLKQKCHILRSEGKSYNFISHETGISKSTLSYWFRGKTEFKEVEKANIEANREASKARLLTYLAKRTLELKHKEFATILDAQKQFEKFKKQPLFMAGLALYAGEGNKLSRQQVTLANSDPLLCLVFVRFMQKYFPDIAKDKMKLWILGYKDHDIAIIEGYWLKILGFERKSLYKTQIIEGKHKTRRLPYGVGSVTISSRFLKVRILELIRLSVKLLTK